MTLHRKIGGIHWFALGRLRISVCLVRAKRVRATAHDTAGEARTKLITWGRIYSTRRMPAREAVRCEPMPSGELFTQPPTPYQGPAFNEAEWAKIRAGGPRPITTNIAGEVVPFKPSKRRPRPALPHTTAFPWPPETKL